MSAVSATAPERPKLTPDQYQLAQDLLSDRLPPNWSKETDMKDIDRYVSTFYDENGIPRAYIYEISKFWDPSASIDLLTLEQGKAALEAKKEREALLEQQRKETDEKLKQVLADRKNVKEPSHSWGLYLKKDTLDYQDGDYCSERYYLFIHGFFSSEKVAKLALDVLTAKQAIHGLDLPVIAQDYPWAGRYFHVNGFTNRNWHQPIFGKL